MRYLQYKETDLISKGANALFDNRFLSQIVGFGAAGIISIGVNFIVTGCLHELLNMPARIAYAFGLATTIVINFIFIRSVIFQSHNNFSRQFFIFLFSSFVFRGLEWLVFVVIETIADLPYWGVMFFIHAVSAFIKFCYYKIFLFK